MTCCDSRGNEHERNMLNGMETFNNHQMGLDVLENSSSIRMSILVNKAEQDVIVETS